MMQERKRNQDRPEKFEDGVLRADACFDRHSLPRKHQYRTWQEDLPCCSFGSSAVREEQRLLRDVHRLLAIGLAPAGHESLEEFVERYHDCLEEVI